ncbi:hypothetical protein [Rahnella inusitata]|uniref:hypothetical protein n=1 Tax=Rahnella inusitata TaxID=58169 RepID=UPI001BC83DEF|nr:hypothetical protein [Rahnella inusitata]QUT16692.1 hypothetical protein I2123_07910 [Rahnella inusitata]
MDNNMRDTVRIHFIEWNSEYERMMTSSLKKDFNVAEIYRVKQHFKSVQKLLPGRTLKRWHQKLQIAIKFRHIADNDIVISNGYSAFLMLDLIAPLRCKKILVLRDSVAALTSKRRRLKLLSENENYLDRVSSVFDVIYSFDPQDCLKYNLSYVDQFLPFTLSEIRTHAAEPQIISSPPSCFYVGGYDSYRAEFLRELASLLQRNHCHPDFYLVDGDEMNSDYPSVCVNKKLTYHQNIEKLKKSSIVVEINKPGQTGLTLRALEAMAFNKKLITNNVSVKTHVFYHPDRVFIWGEDNFERMTDFIEAIPPKLEKGLLDKYCADGMLKTLVGTALK